MNIDPNIKDTVIPIQELKPIRIFNSDANAKILVAISVGELKIVEDVFYAGISLDVEVNIRDIVLALLSLDNTFLENLSQDCRTASIYQEGSAVQIKMSATKGQAHQAGYFADTPDDTATFIVTSASTGGRITDINELTVPQDYMLPMLFPAGYLDSTGKTVLKICNLQQDIAVPLPEEDARSANAMIDAIFCIESLASTDGVELTAEVLDSSGKSGDAIKLPLLHVSAKSFEQYLFRNNYGGFDNVPMSGARKFIPEYTFETGIRSGKLWKTAPNAEIKAFSQDTGYLPRQTMRALSELLLSNDIYHLKDGKFMKIVITGSTLSLSSMDTAHSATFTYRYSDESEPLKLI